MATQTINEALADEAIRHALALRGYTNNVVRRLIAVLNRADDRLFAELTAGIERLGAESLTAERLDAMLHSVRALNKAAYDTIGRELNDVLRDFVEYEADYQRQALVGALPISVPVAEVSVTQVYASAMARPFQGVLLREVWTDLDGQRMRLVRRAIAQGLTEGKPTAQIVRELRGTKAKGYADGIVNKTRRDVEAVVRTAMGHYAGFVADEVASANADLVKGVQWVSTLDLRTTTYCMVRDGKAYTLDHKPIGHSLPWGGGPGRAHWNCRSHQTMILKSWQDLGGEGGDDLPAGSRASMDGQVAAGTTYGDWLKRQSAARQDEALGPRRGKLLRAGKLSLDDMYDSKGTFLTLEQLRERDAAAFKRAGV